MKTFVQSLSCLLMLLFAASASAQQKATEQPHFFAQQPSSIHLSTNVFQELFNTQAGSTVLIALSENFHFPGTVISNNKPYHNLQTVIVKSSAHQQALMQISKITGADNQISYTGKIMHPASADGFSLKKDEKAQYHFEKFESKKILQDCSF